MRDDRNRNAPSRQDSTDINRSNVIVLPSLSRAHCPNRKDLTTFFTNLFRHADQNGIISLRAFFKNGTRDFALAYIVRAVTPGEFKYPALVAEDMYEPETTGRTAIGKLTVGAR